MANPPFIKGEQQQIDEILNQKFIFLGMGHQAYAFLSNDGQYVLKLFKFGKFKPYRLTKTLGSVPFIHSYLELQESRRLGRLEKLFTAHQLAFLLDKDNSGLLFVYLDPS